jgi:hypothetical protein
MEAEYHLHSMALTVACQNDYYEPSMQRSYCHVRKTLLGTGRQKYHLCDCAKLWTAESSQKF